MESLIAIFIYFFLVFSPFVLMITFEVKANRRKEEEVKRILNRFAESQKREEVID